MHKYSALLQLDIVGSIQRIQTVAELQYVHRNSLKEGDFAKPSRIVCWCTFVLKVSKMPGLVIFRSVPVQIN